MAALIAFEGTIDLAKTVQYRKLVRDRRWLTMVLRKHWFDYFLEEPTNLRFNLQVFFEAATGVDRVARRYRFAKPHKKFAI